MASVYTKRIIEGSFAAGITGVLYTVPGGTTTVIRCISVFADGGTAGYVQLILTGVVTLASVTTPSGGPAPTWEGRQAINAGETLKINVVGTTVEVSVTAYELVA